MNLFGVKSNLKNVLSDSVDVNECYILDDFVHLRCITHDHPLIYWFMTVFTQRTFSSDKGALLSSR